MARRDQFGRIRIFRVSLTNTSTGTGAGGGPSPYNTPEYYFGTFVNSLGEFTSLNNPEGRASSMSGIRPANNGGTFWSWSNGATNSASKIYKCLLYDR